MFRTSKCSSSGRLVYAVLWYVKFANVQQAKQIQSEHKFFP